MDSRSLQKLTFKVIDIAREAARLIMDVYLDPTGFSVERKEDLTPVTRADQISSKYIEQQLNLLFPEALVVSEEGIQWGFEERKRYRYIFLVDPLDGTKEFIRKNGEFCINIALVREGKPISGVIVTPAGKQVFYAYHNGGAWQLTPEGKNIGYHCSRFNWKGTGVRFITSRSHMNADTSTFIRGFVDPVILQRGSAIKFAWIARGDADVYPKIGTTMEWDTAAGQIILEEAGGQVLDFHEKSPLRYNKERLYNPDFIAFGKTLSA